MNIEKDYTFWIFNTQISGNNRRQRAKRMILKSIYRSFTETLSANLPQKNRGMLRFTVSATVYVFVSVLLLHMYHLKHLSCLLSVQMLKLSWHFMYCLWPLSPHLFMNI